MCNFDCVIHKGKLRYFCLNHNLKLRKLSPKLLSTISDCCKVVFFDSETDSLLWNPVSDSWRQTICPHYRYFQ